MRDRDSRACCPRVRGSAQRAAAVEKERPDLIIVDMALPDRDALEDIRSVSSASPVVMFAGTDDPAFACEAIAAGVCSYNLSGVAFQDVRPIMASAIALFQRHRHVETELAAARALLEERRLIERAKAILMKDRKMTEPDAYRWLQKKAMNESRKLAQIVADFVAAPCRDASNAGEKAMNETIMGEIVSLNSGAASPIPKLRIGLPAPPPIRRTDHCRAWVGWFAEEGLDTELIAEPSWANIADKLQPTASWMPPSSCHRSPLRWSWACAAPASPCSFRPPIFRLA